MTRDPEQERRQAPDGRSLHGEARTGAGVDGSVSAREPGDDSSSESQSSAEKSYAFKAQQLILAVFWTGAVFGLYRLKPDSFVFGLLLWLVGLAAAALWLGKINRWTVGQDLTLRKLKARADRMERRVDKRSASLYLRQRQLQTLADNIQDGVYLKNSHQEFILVNSRLSELIEAPAERLLGSNGYDLLEPARARRIKELTQKVIDEKRALDIYDLFDQAALPDGRILSLHLFPVINPDGTVEGTGGLLKEVTDGHHRERELIRAREESQKAAQAKSAFLANISHEFRSPLNGIIGTADLLARGRLTADQAAMAAVIKNAGLALLGALNEVLDLSKISHGAMLLNKRPFNLRELIFETLKGLAPIARNKNLKLLADISSQTPGELFGDDIRLRQILLNLVSNALKFTNEGEVRITVSPLEAVESPDKEQGPGRGRESEAGPVSRLRLSVRDTGIGIPEDKKKIIFEAFEQVDSSSTRNYGGVGLGLPICHRLAAMMGSKLNLVSAEGRGSTFWLDLELPVISEAAAPHVEALGAWESFDSASLAAGLSAEASQVSSRSLRVLLAEDMEVNQFVARRMLEELGHQVTVAANGAEALSLFEADSFDLILMDIQMPIMDGLTAMARIRELEIERRRPHTPVAAMTAHALQGDREKYLAQGLDGYLSKPLLMSELAGLIEDMIEGEPKPFPPQWPIVNQTSELTADLGSIQDSKGLSSADSSRRSPMIDLEVTKLSFGGNRQLLRKSMELYLRDAPVVADRITAALADGQPGEAASQAHALKGISSYYTKSGPYLLAMDLDKRSRQANWPEDRSQLMRLAADLRSSVDDLMAEMRTYLSSED